ncbi:MAG: DUF4250 domain-containing protein [Clostridia bacterium]|nr:DUF4250 domain-containing protein [Clostridia bacterium]
MLPKDAFMLLSYINTKLRDDYSCLADLCEDLNADEEQILTTLKGIGYEYDIKNNKFIGK